MNIEDAIAAITRETLAERRPRGCSEEEIGVADTRFLTLFGHRLPIGYRRVLAQSNGLKYNGMTVWPILAQFGFSQTVFEANEDLRDTFDGRFLYFAQWDEELYVFDTALGKYCAIEFVGKPVWMEFEDDVRMFEFLLARVME